jgi:hypothetical protein
VVSAGGEVDAEHLRGLPEPVAVRPPRGARRQVRDQPLAGGPHDGGLLDDAGADECEGRGADGARGEALGALLEVGVGEPAAPVAGERGVDLQLGGG